MRKKVFRCPRCGAATWGNNRVCPQCGDPLTIKCSECGEEWRYYYGYNYCPACGKKVGK
ncbi:MAG: zinc ribbon domain-containing protein [Candidatus Saganbacteria bacterium]|nr:zinc ribbon domain-containing protein [Candidatus Saganbacteria bacterium]